MKLIRFALAAAAMALAMPAGAAAQDASSFQAQLGAEGIAEPAAVECSLGKGTLSCAVYGAQPPAGAQCSAGGTVLELRLGSAGHTVRGHVCVDEGSHDQGVLPAGQAWRRGGFACTHGWLGQGLGRFGRLVCSNKAGYEFSVDAHGRVRTPSGPRRLWLALGDSYASGEGIPGTEADAAGPNRECSRATGRGTDAKAWAVGAYELTKDPLGIGRIAFTACTGAKTDDIAAQIEEAQVGVSGRAWDVVTVGIGGNNLDFVGVLIGCVTDIPSSWDEFDDPSGCDQSTDQLKRRVDMLTGRRDRLRGEYKGEVTLPQALNQIANVVEPGGDVIVTGYPQIVEEVERWDGWRRTLIGHCEFILAKDIGKLRSVTGYLNEQMAKAVQRADRDHKREGIRFHWVDIARDPYEYTGDPGSRHALCSRDPWLNGVTLGTWSDGFRYQRSFHPKQVGHTNTARVVANLIHNDVKPGDAPDTPLLAGPGGDEPGAGQALLGPLTVDGLAPVRLGMTMDEVEERTGLSFRRGPFCVSPEGDSGTAFELNQRRVAAIVLGRGTRFGTASGIHIGDRLNKVFSTYGSQAERIRGSEAVGQGPDAIYLPDDSPNAMVFWADPQGRISLIASGEADDVRQRVEFCA